jgi:hypothetical protein
MSTIIVPPKICKSPFHKKNLLLHYTTCRRWSHDRFDKSKQRQVHRTRPDRSRKHSGGDLMGRSGGGSSGDNEPRRRSKDENDRRGQQNQYGDRSGMSQPQQNQSGRRLMQSSLERERGERYRGGREFKNQNRNKNNENMMSSLSPPPQNQNYSGRERMGHSDIGQGELILCVFLHELFTELREKFVGICQEKLIYKIS